MSNVLPFGKADDEMPGTLIGCLLESEQAELGAINQEAERLEREMDKLHEKYRKFVLRTLDRMGQFDAFDPEIHLILFNPNTGEVWKAEWEEYRRWME